MTFRLRAIDISTGEALCESGGKWYRFSVGNAWRPVPLADEHDAAHCTFLGTYVAVDETFPAVQDLVQELRRRCSSVINADPVALDDILDLCPPHLLRTLRRDSEDSVLDPLITDADRELSDLAVAAALAELSRSEREIFRLDTAGHTLAEIGAVVGQSPRTMGRRLAKIAIKIHALIGRLESP